MHSLPFSLAGETEMDFDLKGELQPCKKPRNILKLLFSNYNDGSIRKLRI